MIPTAKKGDSRLTGGPTKAYGQLQIFHDGQWGVVCRRDGWDQSSAQVMCRELGYAGVLHQLAWHTKNDPELPVWESSINCLGNESRLEDCVVVLGEGGSCGNRFALAVCDTPPKSDCESYLISKQSFSKMIFVSLLNVSENLLWKNRGH